jgi:hypothetical protein
MEGAFKYMIINQRKHTMSNEQEKSNPGYATTNDPKEWPDSPFEPIEQIMHIIEKQGHAMSEEPVQDQTDDEELRNDPEYQKVISLVNSLWESGIIRRGSNFCLSMSDLIHQMLSLHNIKSRVIECKLTVLGIDPPGYALVGHNGLRFRLGGALDPNNFDTHVVCITETKIPMLIDLSINHLRKEVQFICERINGLNNATATTVTKPEEVLAHYNFGASTWTYQAKVVGNLPVLHQRSILDRIELDRKVSNSIKWLFVLNGIVILLTLANLLRGVITHLQLF